MLPTWRGLLPTRGGRRARRRRPEERADTLAAVSLLASVDRRLVLLHALGRMSRDRARHDVLHLRRPRQILEGPAKTALGERLAEADRVDDVRERLVEDAWRAIAARDAREE